MEGVHRDRIGQDQVGDLEILGSRLRDDERFVVGLHEPGAAAVQPSPSGGYVGRNTGARAQFLGDHGAHAGKAGGGGRHMPGHGVVGAFGVGVGLVLHGADDRQLVHVSGHTGQQFRDLDSGHIGGDGLESAVPLHVPGIQMALSAMHPDENAGLRLGLFGVGGSHEAGQLEIIAQAEAQIAQGAHPQEFPSPPEMRPSFLDPSLPFHLILLFVSG